jgi:uncharacterized protein DUF3800
MNGQRRSAWIIPKPFFVHSDLTTGVQLADLVAYIVSWNVRFRKASEPARAELDPLGTIVIDMRYLAVRCRPPRAWDHLELSFARSMGPPVRQ